MSAAVLLIAAVILMPALLWAFARSRRRSDAPRSTPAFEPTRDHWALAASCGIGAWSWDERTDTIDWDASMFVLLDVPTGRGPADLDAFVDLLAPADRPRVREALTTRISSTISINLECRTAKTGRPIRLLATRTVPDPDAAFDGARVVGLCQDAARREELEQRQQEHQRQTAFFTAVGMALTEGGSTESALERCAKAMIDHLDVAVCRIWTTDAAGATLELKASAGLADDLDREPRRIPVDHFTNGLMADQRWVARERLHGFGGYPLLVDDRLVGVLTMFSRSSLSPSTIAALAIVAKQLALGIQRRQGDLAAAVGHDLNNLLTAILVCVDMLKRRLTPGGAEQDHVDDIETAATRAADLTRQLLAFGTRTP